VTLTQTDFADQIEHLRLLSEQATSEAEVRAVISKIAQINRRYRVQHGIGIPNDPLVQAQEIDPSYRERAHLKYLSDEIAEAVRDVERGQNRMIATSMPPRAGKSTLTSMFAPLWMLRRHPEWEIVMTSFDSGLTTGWARTMRTLIEDKPELGIALKKDGGAGGRWETLEGGGMYSVSIGGPLTGRGARVMIIDDPVSDFAAAHSPRVRQNLWDWWLSVAQTRLEPPYLVLVTMTRWHEDDFVGRLLSPEYEGNPKDWKRIILPALAEKDGLGRAPEEPLLLPTVEESPEEAVARWATTKENVGTYTWAGMYQQRPAPAKGAIFDAGWWRYWTWDPDKATDDGRVVFLDPSKIVSGRWLDSWDMNFDSGASADYVVGQRWVRLGANRFLIAQTRGRWNFTDSIKRMKQWAGVIPEEWDIENLGPYDPYDLNRNPYGKNVHERFIEKKANGAAAINVLHDTIPGLKPVNPHTSKELRARAVTPEIESGNVYLPHPTDPGNDWVPDLLSELRNFPHDAHDDQTDTLTQALLQMRDEAVGGITNPARKTGPQYTRPRSLAQAARSDIGRPRGR
jgi:predicted phage terminase large subunit-like protein